MGRPREFEIERAIDKATDLFWRNGYDRTSVHDLTKEIGITAPSFYFAFGNKEGLFKKVIERYFVEQSKAFEAACREPTAHAVAARLLYGYADLLTDSAHAPGCLAMNSALPCAADTPIRAWLADLREQLRVRLRDRFAYAKTARDLPKAANPDALARLVTMTAWGMAVDAQAGVRREDLHKAVATVLENWPRTNEPT